MGVFTIAARRRSPAWRSYAAWAAACTLAGAGLAGGLALTGEPAAAQAGPACGSTSVSGATTTVTCGYTGAAQYWTPPAGITSATFTLYGAEGGTFGPPHGAAGVGAEVTGTLPVTPGTALQVSVGQAGGYTIGAGTGSAFGGGGKGGVDAGGGGGASDVRDGSYALADRLLVAGGGGGGGPDGSSADSPYDITGGAGGNADSAGVTGGSAVGGCGETLSGGDGGGAGTGSAGGAGGSGGSVTSGSTCGLVAGADGTPGGQGTGGNGGNFYGGGGGGGGYYGGGAGGGINDDQDDYWAATGGGGGGSSFTGAATGTSVDDGVAAPDDAPNGEVKISYTLAVTTTSLPDGVQGSGYSQTLTAVDGVTPDTWSLAAGSSPLPPGLTISGGGVISGTPTATGTYDFTVQVTDSSSPTAAVATQALSITVEPALAIGTTSLRDAVQNSSYSQTLAASGGIPPYTWSLAAGSSLLPPGLTLSGAGVISGTPATSGSFGFTVQVTDSESPAVSVTRALSITIAPPLTVTTKSLLAATGGQVYTATLAASGGIPPYTWSVAAGSLPPGLSLDASTGVISGTPDVAGTYDFTVTVTDSQSPAGAASKALSISVSGPVITAIRPDSGPVTGFTALEITGTGLSCPAGKAGCKVTVTFGGKAATVNPVSSDEILADSPPGTKTGTVTVIVTVGGVSSQATAVTVFTYTSPVP